MTDQPLFQTPGQLAGDPQLTRRHRQPHQECAVCHRELQVHEQARPGWPGLCSRAECVAAAAGATIGVTAQDEGGSIQTEASALADERERVANLERLLRTMLDQIGGLLEADTPPRQDQLTRLLLDFKRQAEQELIGPPGA